MLFLFPTSNIPDQAKPNAMIIVDTNVMIVTEVQTEISKQKHYIE